MKKTYIVARFKSFEDQWMERDDMYQSLWWEDVKARDHFLLVESIRKSECGAYWEITTVEPHQVNVSWGPTKPTREFELHWDGLLVCHGDSIYGSLNKKCFQFIPARLQLA